MNMNEERIDQLLGEQQEKIQTAYEQLLVRLERDEVPTSLIIRVGISKLLDINQQCLALRNQIRGHKLSTDEAVARISTLEVDLQIAQQEAETAERELVSRAHTIEELRDAQNTHRQECQNLQAAIEQKEQRIVEYRAEVDEYKRAQQAKTDRISELITLNTTAGRKESNLKNEVKRLTADMKKKQESDAAKLEDAEARHAAAVAELNLEITDAKTNLEQARDKQTQSTRTIEELQSEIARANNKAEEMKKEHADAIQKLEHEASAKLDKTEKELQSKMNAQLVQAQLKIDAADTKLTEEQEAHTRDMAKADVDLKQEQEAHARDVDEVDARCAEAQKLHELTKQVVETLQLDLSESRAEIDTTKSALAKAQEELRAETTRHSDTLANMLKSHRQSIAVVKSDLEREQEAHAREVNQGKAEVQKHQLTKQAVERLRLELVEVNLKLSESQAEIDTTKSALTKANVDLEQEQEAHAQEVAKGKAEVQEHELTKQAAERLRLELIEVNLKLSESQAEIDATKSALAKANVDLEQEQEAHAREVDQGKAEVQKHQLTKQVVDRLQLDLVESRAEIDATKSALTKANVDLEQEQEAHAREVAKGKAEVQEHEQAAERLRLEVVKLNLELNDSVVRIDVTTRAMDKAREALQDEERLRQTDASKHSQSMAAIRSQLEQEQEKVARLQDSLREKELFHRHPETMQVPVRSKAPTPRVQTFMTPTNASTNAIKKRKADMMEHETPETPTRADRAEGLQTFIEKLTPVGGCDTEVLRAQLARIYKASSGTLHQSLAKYKARKCTDTDKWRCIVQIASMPLADVEVVVKDRACSNCAENQVACVQVKLQDGLVMVRRVVQAASTQGRRRKTIDN